METLHAQQRLILLQLSAAQGPVECALAVAHAVRRLQQEASSLQVSVQWLEHQPGALAGTFASVVLSLEGDAAAQLAQHWQGSLLWVSPSPYRPGHGRKNWFFAGQLLPAPAPAVLDDIRFETLRSSGPGGQHVNTTETAVRATHLGTGITVKVQSERSQHANKRLARLLIAKRLAEQAAAATRDARAHRRQLHRDVERGNPVRRFVGANFAPG